MIPHYDNAVGGTHDTRYCYLGERRLGVLERELPDGAAVLGVDEHTAAIVDPDSGSVEVRGRGGITVRRQGHGESVPAGETLPLPELRALLRGASTRSWRPAAPATEAAQSTESQPSQPGTATLREVILDGERRFDAAVAEGVISSDTWRSSISAIWLSNLSAGAR